MDQSIERSAYLKDAIGADLAGLYPGEIRVTRSVRREEVVRQPDGSDVMKPVWILVAEGRAIVSTTRFLQHIVTEWAESFSAPEHLLNPVFQDELCRAIKKAADASVLIERERVHFRDVKPDTATAVGKDMGRLVRFVVTR